MKTKHTIPDWEKSFNDLFLQKIMGMVVYPEQNLQAEIKTFIRGRLYEQLDAVDKMIGEDEDDDWEEDGSTGLMYEDACDAETRNELRAELRKGITSLREEI